MDRFRAKEIDLATWNLTLSALIKYDKSFLVDLQNIQDKVLKNISDSKIITSKYIYRCPSETFHFSMVNFASMKGPSRQDFEFMLRNKKKEIVKAVRKDQETFRKWSFTDPRLYPSSGENGNSIALNLSIKELKDKNEAVGALKNIFSLADLDIETKLPAVVINLVRFFGEPNKEEKKIMSHNIDNLNKLLRSRNSTWLSEFHLKKLSLVISNMYLTNRKTEIKLFNLS